MRALWFACVVLLVSSACGRTSLEAQASGSLEIVLGESNAWPSTVQSALVRLSRSGGGSGCEGGATWIRHCWCAQPGPGCDFAGDPPPHGLVEGLCPGEWLLDTQTTAVFSKSACAEGSILSTQPIMTPSSVEIGLTGTPSVNVTFQSEDRLEVDILFEG